MSRRASMRSTADSTSLTGVISDTHGLLRPEALAALEGCDRIIHAGDLGKAEVFERLSGVAPTDAVRGNVDRGGWADVFPETLNLTMAGVPCYVLHDLNTLDFDPVTTGIGIVISGHSHQPVVREESGVVYLNPGSAGPRRFTLPVTIARLEISPAGMRVTIIDVLKTAVAETLTAARARGVSATGHPGA